MQNNRIKNLCLAGVLTALVFVFTAYLHIPVYTGYTHIGDGFIFLSACLLPLPYGIFVGSVGALLADCLTGYALWAPASVLIKGLTVLFFCRRNQRLLSARNLIALLPAGILCIGGYYLYEGWITGNFLAPLAGVWGNLLQWLFSSGLFILLAFIIDRFHLKDKI